MCKKIVIIQYIYYSNIYIYIYIYDNGKLNGTERYGFV